MVASVEGLGLTHAHDLAQAKVEAQALHAATLAFHGLLDPKDLDKSFPAYAKTVEALISKYRGNSAGLSRAYYSAVRKVEGAPGIAPDLALPAELPTAQAATSLLVTGPVQVKSQLGQGASLDDALSTALQMTLGAVGRHVRNGGREMLRSAVHSDPHAGGWARRSGGVPCSFCAMLIGRGPVYKSEATADFRSHDHCHCGIVPFFGDSTGWTGQSQEYGQLWQEATAGASGPQAQRRAFAKAYDAKYGAVKNAATVKTEASLDHVVFEATAATKAAAEASALKAKALDAVAAKQEAKKAALVEKWKDKPAPVAPKMPEAPVPGKAPREAWADWEAEAKARYAALGTGKTLDKSFNWPYFEKVFKGGPEARDALKYLKDNKYLDDTQWWKAREILASHEVVSPEVDAAYKKALTSFRNRSTRHKRYLSEWREANGISGSLAGMDAPALDWSDAYEAHRWAGDNFTTPTGPSRDALTRYTGADYHSWNRELRTANGTPPPGTWERLTTDADAGMSLAPTDFIVRRGTNFDEFAFPNGVRTQAIPPPDPRDLIGTVQIQHGYMSTSVGGRAAFSGQVGMVIRVPEGHGASWAVPYSRHSGENEMLLARGTTFFVHDVYRDPDIGQWIVEVEVVPPGTDPAALAGMVPRPRSTKPKL